jgi:hypothetical protein
MTHNEFEGTMMNTGNIASTTAAQGHAFHCGAALEQLIK